MKNFVLEAALWVAVAGVLVVAGGKHALVVEPSQAWDGNDGPWSSFLLRIGSGLGVQNVRLLPSTNLAETYLINPLGCGNPNTTDIRFPVLGKPCPESRGLFFNHHKSTTYEEWKIFNISEYAALGNYGIREHYAQFGWDDVHFGYPKAAGGWDGPVANSNIIGEITNTTFFWVGVFGLDPRPTNLTDPDGTNNPQKSLLDRLKDNSAIPSSSWAYTAGSMYSGGGGSQGSLILGGYDANRIKRNKVTFPFAYDVERVHSVVLQNIYITLQPEIAPTALNSVHKLKNQTYLYPIIESNRPYIFLPENICEEIARHVGAQYDQRSDHYLMSNRSYEDIKTKSTSLTFQIAPPQSSDYVKISLPFTSLVLKLDSMFGVNNSQWYVPIRRAEDARQLALGRAFLQNAVLISDYERKSFSVHEAVLSSAASEPKIRPILMNRRSTLDSWKGKFSAAEIVGMCIGMVVLVLLIGLFIFCIRRRHNKKVAFKKYQEKALCLKEEAAPDELPPSTSPTGSNRRLQEDNSGTVGEISGDSSGHPTELGNEWPAAELHGNGGTGSLAGFLEGAELDGMEASRAIFEVEGTPVLSESPKRGGGGVGDILNQSLPAYNKTVDQIVVAPWAGGRRFRPQDAAPIGPNRPPLSKGRLVVPTSREQLRPANDVPASPIPKTPSEYYRRADP